MEPSKTRPRGKKPAPERPATVASPSVASSSAAASSSAEPEEATDLAPVVGANLRRLRTKRGLSLEKLSQLSGVSRAMLGQIELGQSAPTINVPYYPPASGAVIYLAYVVLAPGYPLNVQVISDTAPLAIF